MPKKEEKKPVKSKQPKENAHHKAQGSKGNENALVSAGAGRGDLMGYDPGPYDLNLRIQQMQWLIKQDTVSHFMKGCILLEIKQHENLQTFAKILADDFGGMSQRSAYHYMTFAQKCHDLPKIASFAETNWSKAIALYEGCTDEQLEEIEEHGLDGKVIDAYDGMSVREFKQLVAQQAEDISQAEERGKASAKAKIKSLNEELNELRAQVPNGPDSSWAEKALTQIEGLMIELDNRMSHMAFDPRMVDNDNLKAQVEGFYSRSRKRFIEFIDKWEKYCGYKVGANE